MTIGRCASTCLAMVAVVLVGCSDACEKFSCYRTGVLVGGDGIDAARVCLDGECETVERDVDGFLLLETEWTEGRKVQLRIDTLNAAGDTVATIDEERTMFSGCCTTFVYDYRDGVLLRDA